MKRVAAVVVGLVAGGTAVAGGPPFAGFREVAARSEQIEVRKPLWQDGKLRVGSAVGTVKRRSRGQTRSEGGPDAERSLVDRYGSASFSVTGVDVRGTLSGECSYGQRDDRLTVDGWSESIPVGPLRMRCTFRRDGQAIGFLNLGAVPPTRADVGTQGRVGVVEVGGARLRLRSAHAMDGVRMPIDTPLGYWIEDAEGRAVGAVDTNGITRVRLALPRDAAQRDAALAAGVAIAAFWDPGDADD